MTKHLNSLRVQNFRCFKDFTAEKLGDVNLIVGKNNSGKSSLLEAVRLFLSRNKGLLLRNIARDKNEILNNQDLLNSDWIKNFYYNRKITESDIIISDKSNKEKYMCMQFGYSYNENIGNDTFKKIFSTTKPQDNLNISMPTDTVHIKDATGQVSTRISFDKDSSFVTENFEIESETGINYSYVGTKNIDFNNLSSIADDIQTDEVYKKIVIETLQFIEPSIIDFSFKDKDEEAQVKNRYPRLKLNSGDFVPMKSMGDGIATIFEIFIKAFNAKDGILLIDEVENGLHFSVQKQVWRMLFNLSKKLNMQIFATTHSWDAIEAFAEVAKENHELDPDFTGILMRMGRSARTSTKDNIIATIYDEDRLFDITQQEIEVR